MTQPNVTAALRLTGTGGQVLRFMLAACDRPWNMDLTRRSLVRFTTRPCSTATAGRNAPPPTNRGRDLLPYTGSPWRGVVTPLD